jgi:uncharacterized Zn-binding protein involved in type VI secretion
MAIPSLIGDATAKGESVAGPGASTVTIEGKPPTLVSSDKTDHGETVTGPGSSTVTIEGKALSFVGDTTTVSVRKNRREFWGPGPITGPGAATVTVGS